MVILIPGTSPPSDVTAVQAGLTSIRVTWTASSDATGYRIYYTSDSDSGSETVSDGSTVTHTLAGLVNGETYKISMIAISEYFPSEAISSIVSLSKDSVFCLAICMNSCHVFHLAPGQPVVDMEATVSTISLSWSVPAGSVVSRYEVKWASDQCPDHGVGNSTTTVDNSTSYTISDLRPGTSYTASVTAINSAGNSSSETATVETEEEGELFVKI